ncbi:hypothetical protein CRUP_038762, partial [Coryphaenoides rupestris]
EDTPETQTYTQPQPREPEQEPEPEPEAESEHEIQTTSRASISLSCPPETRTEPQLGQCAALPAPPTPCYSSGDAEADMERPEGGASTPVEVPAGERPNVPLSSLKMMFENGGASKVFSEQEETGGHTAEMDQLSGDCAAESSSTPLKDRMALYQAAVSKQEVLPTSLSSDQLDGYSGKQKENVPPFSPDM